jgi:hypothetical protein
MLLHLAGCVLASRKLYRENRGGGCPGAISRTELITVAHDVRESLHCGNVDRCATSPKPKISEITRPVFHPPTHALAMERIVRLGVTPL